MPSSTTDTGMSEMVQVKCQVLLRQLLSKDDNSYCVDCMAMEPRWASVNLGIFLCFRCARMHQNLGADISKIVAVNVDTWTLEQVACLQQMGNSKARAVYEANLPDKFRRPETDPYLETFIQAKYVQKKYIAKEWFAPSLPPVLEHPNEEVVKEFMKDLTRDDVHLFLVRMFVQPDRLYPKARQQLLTLFSSGSLKHFEDECQFYKEAIKPGKRVVGRPFEKIKENANQTGNGYAWRSGRIAHRHQYVATDEDRQAEEAMKLSLEDHIVGQQHELSEYCPDSNNKVPPDCTIEPEVTDALLDIPKQKPKPKAPDKPLCTVPVRNGDSNQPARYTPKAMLKDYLPKELDSGQNFSSNQTRHNVNDYQTNTNRYDDQRYNQRRDYQYGSSQITDFEFSDQRNNFRYGDHRSDLKVSNQRDNSRVSKNGDNPTVSNYEQFDQSVENLRGDARVGDEGGDLKVSNQELDLRVANRGGNPRVGNQIGYPKFANQDINPNVNRQEFDARDKNHQGGNPRFFNRDDSRFGNQSRNVSQSTHSSFGNHKEGSCYGNQGSQSRFDVSEMSHSNFNHQKFLRDRQYNNPCPDSNDTVPVRNSDSNQPARNWPTGARPKTTLENFPPKEQNDAGNVQNFSSNQARHNVNSYQTNANRYNDQRYNQRRDYQSREQRYSRSDSKANFKSCEVQTDDDDDDEVFKLERTISEIKDNKLLGVEVVDNRPVMQLYSGPQEMQIEEIKAAMWMEKQRLLRELKKPPPTRMPSNLNDLLSQIGLSKYSKIFMDEEINLDVFATLTDSDLKEIGINHMGPRKIMLAAIAKLNREVDVVNQKSSKITNSKNEDS